MKLENEKYSSYHLFEIFPLGIQYHGDEVRSQEAVFCQIDCRRGIPQIYHVKLHLMAYPDIQPIHFQRKLDNLRNDEKKCVIIPIKGKYYKTMFYRLNLTTKSLLSSCVVPLLGKSVLTGPPNPR